MMSFDMQLTFLQDKRAMLFTNKIKKVMLVTLVKASDINVLNVFRIQSPGMEFMNSVKHSAELQKNQCFIFYDTNGSCLDILIRRIRVDPTNEI